MTKGKNTYAVMAQRCEPRTSLDDFPTPPWGTRALMEHVIGPRGFNPNRESCLEPACNRGYMARTLQEYFTTVAASDVHDYGYGYPVSDFLNYPQQDRFKYEWIITNPPFKDAEKFIAKAVDAAGSGVAILARTSFLEGIGRYERLYSVTPPALIAQFTERLPMVKGRVDRKASTATSYAWFIWKANRVIGHRFSTPDFKWIPPCRKVLERDSDYEL